MSHYTLLFFFFFFFNDTATTEIYTLSLHDALPISVVQIPPEARVQLDAQPFHEVGRDVAVVRGMAAHPAGRDRKSTRLNSSHLVISYAVFCLKKKKNINQFTY